MKKRLALIMATAMIASALSGTVAFASEADDTAAAAEETKDDAAGGEWTKLRQLFRNLMFLQISNLDMFV